MSKISRRDLFKRLGAIGVFVALSNVGSKFKQTSSSLIRKSIGTIYPPAVEKARWGMMIDVGACIGCRRCLHACKLENNIPDEPNNIHWIDLYEMEDVRPVSEIDNIPPLNASIDYVEAPKPEHWYLSFNCFHCENPPCTKVCPTGATYKDDDGIVLVNYEICIGCRYCMAACPYNARRFNWWKPEHPPARESPIDGSLVPINDEVPLRERGVTEKCTFCVHRIRNGNKLPRCVEICPVSARHFGDFNDPDSEVSRLLKTVRTHRVKENLGTQPQLFYITRGVKWTSEGEKF
jgi:molybdopterin-containing oxidoreductase family iron-sulfur binding subunit